MPLQCKDTTYETAWLTYLYIMPLPLSFQLGYPLLPPVWGWQVGGKSWTGRASQISKSRIEHIAGVAVIIHSHDKWTYVHTCEYCHKKNEHMFPHMIIFTDATTMDAPLALPLLGVLRALCSQLSCTTWHRKDITLVVSFRAGIWIQ